MATINLYNIDCMEFMKGLPDKSYDLAIVDVNYGLGEAKGQDRSRNIGRKDIRNGKTISVKHKGYAAKDWDSEPPPVEYFIELRRVSKSQIIWGANHFISRMPYDSSGWIVWDKVNGDSDFSDCELAWTSFDRGLRKVAYMWSGFLQGKSIEEGTINQGSVKLRELRIHPTQKPIALYKWLLENYSKPDQRILDTHGGSMSIAIACYDLGFDLDLCELDPDYFKAGKERYEAHVAKYAPASIIPATKHGELKLF